MSPRWIKKDVGIMGNFESFPIPAELIKKLDFGEISYEVFKGKIYYLTTDDYISAQRVIDKMQKENPTAAYNKYGNRKVSLKLNIEDRTPDMGSGFEYVTFDSEDEAEFYFHLVDEKEAGKIIKFELQPRIELFPTFVDLFGVKQRAIIYTPDFFIRYNTANYSYAYIDVKGMSTQQGDLRRKLYNYLSATGEKGFSRIPLYWVAYSKKYGDADGWIDYDKLQQCRAKARKEKKNERAVAV